MQRFVVFFTVMAVTHKRRKAQRSPISVAINAAGLSLDDVARRSGLSIGRVRNLVANAQISRKGRARIEAACGGLSLWPATSSPSSNPPSQ